MWESLADVYTILKIVAVLVGVVLGAFVGRVLAPFVGNRKASATVIVFCAALGGLALWLAVSRVGGKGGGEGDGTGPGGGYAKSSGNGGEKRSASEKAGEPEPETLKVTMLGGDLVKDQRFYVIGHESPRTWDELMAAISKRRKDPGLKAVEIVIFDNSVARDSPAVRDLEDWATAQNLTVATKRIHKRLPQQ